MMGDKSVDEVIKILFRPSDRVFTVRADDGPRAAEAADLAERVGSNAVPADSVGRAYRLALAEAGPDGVVCVCGSLYLVGTFKATVDVTAG
jgi:dihydrofolate synthase/folylpolyglutamate synthase